MLTLFDMSSTLPGSDCPVDVCFLYNHSKVSLWNMTDILVFFYVHCFHCSSVYTKPVYVGNVLSILCFCFISKFLVHALYRGIELLFQIYWCHIQYFWRSLHHICVNYLFDHIMHHGLFLCNIKFHVWGKNSLNYHPTPTKKDPKGINSWLDKCNFFSIF